MDLKNLGGVMPLKAEAGKMWQTWCDLICLLLQPPQPHFVLPYSHPASPPSLLNLSPTWHNFSSYFLMNYIIRAKQLKIAFRGREEWLEHFEMQTDTPWENCSGTSRYWTANLRGLTLEQHETTLKNKISNSDRVHLRPKIVLVISAEATNKTTSLCGFNTDTHYR